MTEEGSTKARGEGWPRFFCQAILHFLKSTGNAIPRRHQFKSSGMHSGNDDIFLKSDQSTLRYPWEHFLSRRIHQRGNEPWASLYSPLLVNPLQKRKRERNEPKPILFWMWALPEEEAVILSWAPDMPDTLGGSFRPLLFQISPSFAFVAEAKLMSHEFPTTLPLCICELGTALCALAIWGSFSSSPSGSHWSTCVHWRHPPPPPKNPYQNHRAIEQSGGLPRDRSARVHQ